MSEKKEPKYIDVKKDVSLLRVRSLEAQEPDNFVYINLHKIEKAKKDIEATNQYGIDCYAIYTCHQKTLCGYECFMNVLKWCNLLYV